MLVLENPTSCLIVFKSTLNEDISARVWARCLTTSHGTRIEQATYNLKSLVICVEFFTIFCC